MQFHHKISLCNFIVQFHYTILNPIQLQIAFQIQILCLYLTFGLIENNLIEDPIGDII